MEYGVSSFTPPGICLWLALKIPVLWFFYMQYLQIYVCVAQNLNMIEHMGFSIVEKVSSFKPRF